MVRNEKIELDSYTCTYCDSESFEKHEYYCICTGCRRYITRKVFDSRKGIKVQRNNPIQIGMPRGTRVK